MDALAFRRMLQLVIDNVETGSYESTGMVLAEAKALLARTDEETKLLEVAARAAAFIEEVQPPFDCPFSLDDLDTLRGVKTVALL